MSFEVRQDKIKPNLVRLSNCKILVELWIKAIFGGVLQGCSPRPPPRKNALPYLAPPHPTPQKLTKPAGRNGAKLTVDYTDYALPFGLRVGK